MPPPLSHVSRVNYTKKWKRLVVQSYKDVVVYNSFLVMHRCGGGHYLLQVMKKCGGWGCLFKHPKVHGKLFLRSVKVNLFTTGG